jgi:glycolate oxidase iron-sulfur subunit
MGELTSIANELNRCSRCGGCQSVCPLFAETKLEPLVARGKIFLLKNYLDGQIELTDKMKELMSLCLLCKACVAQCPNQVPVDKLVLRAREEAAKVKGISFVKKNVFQHLLQNNGRLTAAARMAYLYQHCGAQWLVRKSGLLNLAGDLGQKERLLPQMALTPFRSRVPRQSDKSASQRMRVAYFTGCMTNYIYLATGRAVLNVLRRQGVEVVIPEQWCCGIPALASGDQQTAAELARKNVESFRQANVEAIISDCASCGSMLQEYGDLLGTAEAREFSSKALDFSQFLQQAVTFKAGDRPVRQMVTYHDPCHLKRGQGVSEAPRKLLQSVPGLTFKEMKDPDRCCGAAGSFNLTYYDLSQRVGRQKAENIVETGADIVVTGCPSCMMQIGHLLERRGAPQQGGHLAEGLNQSYETES